eukprot:TRINITY_DN3881_c0_g1_i6.p1 TRINITY_DN3881_c0_g1~~TRINITY_DN3881_c0_g1_i6.p1  ORF type:complete len:2013 (+),score=237.36 TRINITY_DN3881_c0_g1_i6:57-6095(+)
MSGKSSSLKAGEITVPPGSSTHFIDISTLPPDSEYILHVVAHHVNVPGPTVADVVAVSGSHIPLPFSSLPHEVPSLEGLSASNVTDSAADLTFTTPGKGLLFWGVRPANPAKPFTQADVAKLVSVLEDDPTATTTGFTRMGVAGILPGIGKVHVMGLMPRTIYSVVVTCRTEDAYTIDEAMVGAEFETNAPVPEIVNLEQGRVGITDLQLDFELTGKGTVRYVIVRAGFQSEYRDHLKMEELAKKAVSSGEVVYDTPGDRGVIEVTGLPSGTELDVYTWPSANGVYGGLVKNRVVTVSAPSVPTDVAVVSITHDTAEFGFTSKQTGRLLWVITPIGTSLEPEDLKAAALGSTDPSILATGVTLIDPLFRNLFTARNLQPSTGYTLQYLPASTDAEVPPGVYPRAIEFTTRSALGKLKTAHAVNITTAAADIVVTPEGEPNGAVRYLLRGVDDPLPSKAEMMAAKSVPLESPQVVFKLTGLSEGRRYTVFLAAEGDEGDRLRVDFETLATLPEIKSIVVTPIDAGLVAEVTMSGRPGRLHWGVSSGKDRPDVTAKEVLVGTGFDGCGMAVQEDEETPVTITMKRLTPDVEHTLYFLPGTADGRSMATTVKTAVGTPTQAAPVILSAEQISSTASTATVRIKVSHKGRVHFVVVDSDSPGKMTVSEFEGMATKTVCFDSGALTTEVVIGAVGDSTKFSAILMSDVPGKPGSEEVLASPSGEFVNVQLTTEPSPPVIVNAAVVSTTCNGCYASVRVSGEPGLVFWAVSGVSDEIPVAAFVSAPKKTRDQGPRRRGSSFVPGTSLILASGFAPVSPSDQDTVGIAAESVRIKPSTTYTLHLSTLGLETSGIPEGATATLVNFTTSATPGVTIGKVEVVPKTASVEVNITATDRKDGAVMCRVCEKQTSQPVPETVKECRIHGGDGGLTITGLQPETDYVLQAVPISPDVDGASQTVDWDTDTAVSEPFRTTPDGAILESVSVGEATTELALVEFNFNRPGEAFYMHKEGDHKPIDKESLITFGKPVSADDVNETVEVELTDLKPDTTYTIYAVVKTEDLLTATFTTASYCLTWVQLLSPTETSVTVEYCATTSQNIVWAVVPEGGGRQPKGVADIQSWLSAEGGDQPQFAKSGQTKVHEGEATFDITDLEPGQEYAFYAGSVEPNAPLLGPETFRTMDSEVVELPADFLQGKGKGSSTQQRSFVDEEKQPIPHEVDINSISTPEYLKALFTVQKSNPDKKMVGKKEKAVVLDFFDRTLTNLAPGKTPQETLLAAKEKGKSKVVKVFNHNHIHRCEKDASNHKKLKMSFLKPKKEYELQFETPAHRERFYECIKALKNGLVWAPSLCPDMAGPHCFDVAIKGSTTSGITYAPKSARQPLTGVAKIRCCNAPTDQLRLWVGCIDLQHAKLPKEVDFGNWLPRSGVDLYVIGVVDKPAEYHENAKLCDMLAKYLGKDFIPLLSTEREQGKRGVALFVFSNMTHKKISNTDAWTGKHIRGKPGGSKGVSDAVALSFSVNETPLCFFCTKIVPPDDEEDDEKVRNEILKDLLGRVEAGLTCTDVTTRFHHLFILGNLAYGYDGDPDPSHHWDRLSNLPFNTDVLTREIENGGCLANFAEGDLELVEEFHEYGLEQRVLCKSYPGLELENISYKVVNVANGRPAVSSLYDFGSQLVYLETFTNPSPPKVSLILESVMLECKTIERETFTQRLRGASRMGGSGGGGGSDSGGIGSRRASVISTGSLGGRRRSVLSAATDSSVNEDYDLGGKSGLAKPYLTMYAEFGEGLYRSAVMLPDEDTRLPTTTRFPVVSPATNSRVFLSRQFILFSVKHDSSRDGREAVLGTSSDGWKSDYYASAVLPLKDVLLSADGRCSFCIPLYSAGVLAGGRLTGVVKVVSTESEAVGIPQMISSSELVVEECWENERKTLIKAFASTNLTSKDPPAWSDPSGTRSTPQVSFRLPPGWVWESDWKVFKSKDTDPEGWIYGQDFRTATWVAKKSLNVRKRRWVRGRARADTAATAN